MRASGRLQNFGGTQVCSCACNPSKQATFLQLGVGGEQVLMRTVDALAVTNVKLMKGHRSACGPSWRVHVCVVCSGYGGH